MKRKDFIKRWSEANPTITKYTRGTYRNGVKYTYASGRRLDILGEQVMDDSETPWCAKNVKLLFRGIRKPVTVLNRGFGLGIDSTLIVKRLSKYGGSLHIIELNAKVAYWARLWSMGMQKHYPNVSITIHEGDSFKVTKGFIKKGITFDLIVSDTYPLSEDENGKNDLLDFKYLKQCLKKNGRFSFFAYFPKQKKQEISKDQARIILNHFKKINVSGARVNPHPEYTYLFHLGKPIRTLPVVICQNPL